jgi:DNA topoisomerase VI subunit B
MSHILERSTFATSRLLEFFSEKELAMQIGHDSSSWPVVILKELVDNALDACEQAGVGPQIALAVRRDGLWVLDNGPGMPADVIERSLDYAVRVSNKAHYVSPTRGQLGNALKCAWAAPFVVDGEHGLAVVDACGVRHRIEVGLDRIAQKPDLRPTAGASVVKNGTRIGLRWPKIASCLEGGGGRDFYNAARLLRSYAAFNPHAAFVLRDSQGRRRCWAATEPAWEKWRPSDPTSAHWYTAERLALLVAAYLTQERDGRRPRTVREFVAEFAGLSGSTKPRAVLEAAGLSKATLQDLASGGGIDREAVARLLAAMKERSRPVKPQSLGILGEEHCRNHMARRCGVDPDSVRYRRVAGVSHDLPFVLEVAFGVKAADDKRRDVYTGVNWSPALSSPFDLLPSLMGEMRLDRHDPVVLLVHLASPQLNYTDRGKSRLTLRHDVAEALEKCVTGAAQEWKKCKRKADRDDRIRERDLERLRKANRPRKVEIKGAAYRVMAEAYRHASSNNTLPANARQIMYAARPLVLKLTGGKCWKRSSYFTQRLLVDFINEHPELTANWDVVYDARGTLREPHTGSRVPLGTVPVRNYLSTWRDFIGEASDPALRFERRCGTGGPANRYRFALFVEKEGFDHLLERARIAERYDLAIMSTKGMSVTAARKLVERLSEAGVTVLVLRDFDKSGFSILHTLAASNGRYRYRSAPRIIDLGLRLEDVREMGLTSEPVNYQSKKQDPRDNLRASGATEEECDFLVTPRPFGGWTGDRVELNAMASDQFIAFLERKLAQAGVTKLVPEQAALERAYRRAVRLQRLEHVIEEAIRNVDQADPEPSPGDLAERIRSEIEGTEMPWDEAVWRIAREDMRG